MFIRYENIGSQRLIDVRTPREFVNDRLFPISIPVIFGEQYAKIKRFYPCAFFVILLGIIKDKNRLKARLLDESNYKTKPIILACSRGRLRSPMMCIYARMLGIDAKVLWGGVKGQLRR